MKDLQELEVKYEEIMQLYDLADALTDTVESEFVSKPEDQLALVAPLIEQIGESADVMTEEFVNLAQKKPTRKTRTRLETALRKLYNAVDGYYEKLGATSKASANALKNIAEPIVVKLKEKLEEIIVIFLDFVKMSLDRVMHKNELEELKRKRHITFQLHDMAQQH